MENWYMTLWNKLKNLKFYPLTLGIYVGSETFSCTVSVPNLSKCKIVSFFIMYFSAILQALVLVNISLSVSITSPFFCGFGRAWYHNVANLFHNHYHKWQFDVLYQILHTAICLLVSPHSPPSTVYNASCWSAWELYKCETLRADRVRLNVSFKFNMSLVDFI